MVSRLILLTFILIFSSSTFGQEEDLSIVDTCNCQELEDFSEDIHAVISKFYQDEVSSDVPVDFDQLTLVMNMQSRFEEDISCSQTYGELSEFEEDITKTVSDSLLITPFQDAIKYSGNISLQEFRPRFMRVASENDRTLFFRTVINGKETYILMFVDRNGETKIEILDAPPAPFSPIEGSPVDLALQEQAQRDGDPVNAEPRSLDLGAVDLSFSLDGPLPEAEPELVSPSAPDSEFQVGMFGDTMFDGGLRVTATQQQVGVERAFETDNGNTLQFGYLINADGSSVRRPVPGDEDFEDYMRELRERNDGSDVAYLDELQRNAVSRHQVPNVDSLRGVTTRANLQYSYRFGDATPVDDERDDDGLLLDPRDSEGIGRRLTFSADLTNQYDLSGELIGEQRALGLDYRNGDLGTNLRFSDFGDDSPTSFELTHGNTNGDNITADMMIRNDLMIEEPRLSFSQMPSFDSAVGSKDAFVGKGDPLTFGDGYVRPEQESYYTLGARGTVQDGLEELSLRHSRADSDHSGYTDLRYNLTDQRLDLDTARADADQSSIDRLQASVGDQGPNSITLTTYREEDSPTLTFGTDGDVSHTTSLHLTDDEYAPSEISYDRIATAGDSSDQAHTIERRNHQGITVAEDRVVLRFSTTVQEVHSRDTSVRETPYEVSNVNPNITDLGYQEYARTTTYTAAELSLNEDSVEGTIVRQIEARDIMGTNGHGFGIYAFHGEEGDAFEGFANFYQISGDGDEAYGCTLSIRRETADGLGRAPAQFQVGMAENSTTCNLRAVSRDGEDLIGEFEFSRRYGNNEITIMADTEGELEAGLYQSYQF